MDWSTAMGVLKYLFLGVFVVFFVMDVLSKKSYQVHSYTAIAISIVFLVLGESCPAVMKIGAIILLILLFRKTLFNDWKRLENKESDKIEM